LFARFYPTFLKQYLRQRLVSARYPGRDILTHEVHESVVLGNGVYVGQDVEIRRDVKIGDHSYVNRGTLIGSGEVGRFCSIGYYCQIGMYEHPIHRVSSSSRFYGDYGILPGKQQFNEFPSPPIIEHDVWIGSMAQILQGVRVGTGAVVAAGAVVTRDVAPYSIVGGVPAKLIRNRFDDQAIAALLQSKWWEMSPAELTQWEDLLTSDNWNGQLPDAFFRKPQKRSA
jgi:acetyltransferase-like isoleucine patch superfamily enzyme